MGISSEPNEISLWFQINKIEANRIKNIHNNNEKNKLLRTINYVSTLRILIYLPI